MSQFQGVKQLAFNVGSRPARDQLIQQGEQRRIIAAQNQMASLDKRMADAAMANRQNKFHEQLAGMLDPSDPLSAAIMAELTGEMKNAESTRGIMQQNEARQGALDMIGPDGPSSTDAFNALIGVGSDKMLGVGNVRTDDQADATVEYKQAQAAERKAAAEKALRTDPTTGRAPKKMSDSTIQQFFGMQYPAGTNPQVVAERIGDFYAFAGDMALQDPKYSNDRIAFAEYMKQYPQGGYNADKAAAVVADSATGPAPESAAPAASWPVIEGRDGKSPETAYRMDDFSDDNPPPSGSVFVAPDGRIMVMP